LCIIEKQIKLQLHTQLRVYKCGQHQDLGPLLENAEAIIPYVGIKMSKQPKLHFKVWKLQLCAAIYAYILVKGRKYEISSRRGATAI